MTNREIKTHGGKPLQSVTLENVLQGKLGPDDLRISADSLLHQARAAEAAGYLPLANGFKRAAELTRLTNRMVMDIYTMLRPGRTGYNELKAMADSLEKEHQAPLNAALLREAAEVYLKRGLIKAE